MIDNRPMPKLDPQQEQAEAEGWPNAGAHTGPQDYITSMQAVAAAGFAELDRGEGIRGTPDEIMDLIDGELGIRAPSSGDRPTVTR